MGIMETKTIQVRNDPREINAANEAFGRWGWSVLNVQITHTQNTKEYQEWYQYGSNAVTVETTTINYATITYQRDKGMKCYDRILELEQEFNVVALRIRGMFAAQREELEKKKKEIPKVSQLNWPVIFGLLMSGLFLGTFLYMLLSGEFENVAFVATDALIIGAVILVFLGCLNHVFKSMSHQNRELASQNKQAMAVINQELSVVEDQEEELIQREKTRIIEEAAALLRAE